jgi:hypothetical protein
MDLYNHYNPELNMGAYIPALIWVISAIICSSIAKKKNVKATLFRQIVVVFPGPFAIPLVYLMRPENKA